MVAKIPPPPPIATNDPALNRWLLELTALLNASGTIDASNVSGLSTTTAQVTANTASIATLTAEIVTINGEVFVINSQITTITGEIATINGQITTLSARNQILNGSGVPGAGLGNNGDLYLNNTGGAGTHLYGKISGAWVAIA